MSHAIVDASVSVASGKYAASLKTNAPVPLAVNDTLPLAPSVIVKFDEFVPEFVSRIKL